VSAFLLPGSWTRKVKSNMPGACWSPPAGWRRNLTICYCKLQRVPSGVYRIESLSGGLLPAGSTEANLYFLSLLRKKMQTSPVAVPEKIIGLSLILNFFDRCHSLHSLHPPPAAVVLLPLPAYISKATKYCKRLGT